MKHFLEGPDRDLNLVFMTEGYCIFLALAVPFSAYLPSWSILGLELRNFLGFIIRPVRVANTVWSSKVRASSMLGTLHTLRPGIDCHYISDA